MRERAKVSSETLQENRGGWSYGLGSSPDFTPEASGYNSFGCDPSECTFDILMTQCTERLV